MDTKWTHVSLTLYHTESYIFSVFSSSKPLKKFRALCDESLYPTFYFRLVSNAVFCPASPQKKGVAFLSFFLKTVNDFIKSYADPLVL